MAAKIFDISCHQDRMFMTGSVPTYNGYAHYVRKLIAKGYKVGIIGQTETAAEKKTTSGRSLVFETFRTTARNLLRK